MQQKLSKPASSAYVGCLKHSFRLQTTRNMQCRQLTVGGPRVVAVRAVPLRLSRAAVVRVRCDDDDMIPLGKIKRGFTPKEYNQLANPKLLGGKTVGEELALIRQEYLKAEAHAAAGEKHLYTSNWDGDVYVGGRWNTLSILYAIFFFTPLLGLLFAWATYGTLWATGTYY